MRFPYSARLMRVSETAVHLRVPWAWIIFGGISVCWLVAGFLGPALLRIVI